jgi:8-oxo-dGTP diphosphatase
MNEYVSSGPEEDAFLAAYDPSGFPSIAVTADIALFTIRHGRLSVLLVERGGFPYRGAWALPGGFKQTDESIETTARRELSEETALGLEVAHLEQLATYATPGRDPRMDVVSVAYVGLVPDLPNPVAGDDASGARWWALDDLALGTPEGVALAFDHAEILADALERVRSKLEYTSLATSFCDATFTLVELRRVYEAVWGEEVHAPNFRRKVLSTTGFVDAVEAVAPSGARGGRPAELYKRGSAALLHPAMLRPGTARGVVAEDTEDGGL